MSRRQRRTYSKEFKQQVVNLYLAGKPRAEIIRDYELTASAFDKWVKQARSTGSFKEKDNLPPEQAELIALWKKNKQLEMENDILKQAALIEDVKTSNWCQQAEILDISDVQNSNYFSSNLLLSSTTCQKSKTSLS